MASKILCFGRSNSSNQSPPHRRPTSSSSSNSSSNAKYNAMDRHPVRSMENNNDDDGGGGGVGSSCVGSRHSSGGGTPRTSSTHSSPTRRGSEETPLLWVVSSQPEKQQRRRRRRLRLLGGHQREEQHPPMSPQRQEDLKTVQFWRQQVQQQQQQDPPPNAPGLRQVSSRPVAIPDTIETNLDPPNLNDLSMDSLEDHVQLDQGAQVWKQKGNIPPMMMTTPSDDSSQAAVLDDNNNANLDTDTNGAFPTFSLEESQELLLVKSQPSSTNRRGDASGSTSTNDNSLLASICSKSATHDTIFTYDDEDDDGDYEEEYSPAQQQQQQQQRHTPEQRPRRFTAESPDLVVARSESYVSSTSSRATSHGTASSDNDDVDNEEQDIRRRLSDNSVLLDRTMAVTENNSIAPTSTQYDNDENSKKSDSQVNINRDTRLPPAAPMLQTSPPPPPPKPLHPYATPQRHSSSARRSPSTPDSNSVYLKSITSESKSPTIGQRPDIDVGDVPPVSISSRSGVFTTSSSRHTIQSQPGESDLLDAIVAATDEKQQVQQSFLDSKSNRIRTSHASAWTPFMTRDAAAVLGLASKETKRKSDIRVVGSKNNKDRNSCIEPSLTRRSTTTTTTSPWSKAAPDWVLSPSARDSPLVQFQASQQNIPVIQHYHHRRTNTADLVVSGGASDRRRERHQHQTEEAIGNPQPSTTWSQEAELTNIEQQLLGIGGGSTAIFPAKLFEAQQEHEFQNAQDDEEEEEDRLSDVPSNVDADTKQRYLQVCRMLKAALIEKKLTTAAAVIHSSSPLDQSVIDSILSEPDFSQGQPIQSRETYSQHQPASQNVNNDSTTHHSRSEPQLLSSDVWSSNDVAASSVGSSAFMDTLGFDVATGLQPQGSGLAPSPSPPQPLNQPIEDVAMNHRAVDPPTTMQIPGSYPLQRIKHAQLPQQQPSLTSPLASEDERSRAALSDLSSALHPGYPFKVLGVEQCGQAPSILTPSMMEALRGFFPVAVSEENFWLKYCSERDGDSIFTLLDKIHSCRHTILCVETTNGHVFGAFCSTPWRVKPTWYGSGEAFLWRLKHPRVDSSPDSPNQQPENHEIEIYPYTGEGGDNMIQYCTEHSLAVGGAHDWYSVQGGGSPYSGVEPPGIGLLIDGDLKGGETNSCTTFANPRLGDRSTPLSNEFDIAALEVWTLTPCTTLLEAQDLDAHHAFRRQIGEGT